MLMGASEIATTLGVSRQRVHQLRRTYADFPTPVAHLATGPVWQGADVQSWHAVHRDRPTGVRIHRTAVRTA
jgi:hypothetical protein